MPWWFHHRSRVFYVLLQALSILLQPLELLGLQAAFSHLFSSSELPGPLSAPLYPSVCRTPLGNEAPCLCFCPPGAGHAQCLSVSNWQFCEVRIARALDGLSSPVSQMGLLEEAPPPIDLCQETQGHCLKGRLSVRGVIHLRSWSENGGYLSSARLLS